MSEGMTVEFLMEPDIIGISGVATLEEALSAMHIGRMNRLLVMDGGDYAGIITATDILNALVQVGDRSFYHQSVAEWMTVNVATIPKDSSVNKLAVTLRDRDISGIPVTDEDGHYVGVVTERDLITYDIIWSDLDNIEVTEDSPIVKEVDEHTTVSPDFTLWQVVDRMLDGKQRELVLVEDEKMIGFFTRADIVRTLSTKSSEIKSSTDYLQTTQINPDLHRFYVPAKLPDRIGRYRRLMNVRGVSSLPILTGSVPDYIVNEKGLVLAYSLWSSGE